MKSAAVIGLASVSFLSVPALAQENGTTDRPQAPSVAKMAPAGPIALGGPWNEFSFTTVGSFAGAKRPRVRK
jgi:hypothetical protein